MKRHPQAPDVPTANESGLPGFEVGVVWIQNAGVGPVATSLLEGVPVYPVMDEADLEQLGAQSL